jgi:regulation of enolase protein 1 (concanavalin A-like superfamily)
MGVFSRRKLQKIFIITLAVVFSYFALTSFIEKSYKNFYDQEGKDVMNIGEGNEERKSKRLEDQFRSRTKVASRENSAESPTDLKSNSSVNIQVQNRSESIYPGKRTHENETKTSMEQLQNVTERRDVTEIPRESSKIPDGRGLQVRFWRGLIAPNLKTLCDHPLFPKGPNERSVLTKLEIRRSENYFAQQVYGYLHPSISGAHKFAVASDDDSEVWLLEEGSKEGARKICYVGDESWSRMDDFDKFPSQRSKPIYLEKDKKYFIEVVHIQRTSDDGLQVAWLQPGATNFSIIDYRSTSLVNETSSANWSVVNRVEFWSEACKGVAGHHHSMKGSPLRVERPRYIDHKGLEQALPDCPYRPDYLNRGGPLPKGKWYFLRKYQVVTCCYPWIVYPRVIKIPAYGNHPLEFTEADSIAKEYMEDVEKKYPG